MQIFKNNIHGEAYQDVAECRRQIRCRRATGLFNASLRRSRGGNGFHTSLQPMEIQPTEARAKKEPFCPVQTMQKQGDNACCYPENRCEPNDSPDSPSAWNNGSQRLWWCNCH